MGEKYSFEIDGLPEGGRVQTGRNVCCFSELHPSTKKYRGPDEKSAAPQAVLYFHNSHRHMFG